jgi:hypothetical protein
VERVAGQLPVLTGLVKRVPSQEAIGKLVQLEGLYDEVDHRIYVIKGTFKGARQTESTLAHELTHALDEQTFGEATAALHAPVADASDAERSVREGSGVLTQLLYGRRFQGERGLIETKLLPPTAPPGSSRLERLASFELGFVYSRGAGFLLELYRRGGMDLVNRAIRKPPVTTASILDPSRWPGRDAPQRPAGTVDPGPGWARSLSATFGAAATYELLFLASPEPLVSRVARAWRGGTVDVWQRPDAARKHAEPTRFDSVVALRWRWASAAGAAPAERAIDRHLRDAFGARPGRNGTWRWNRGGAALSSAGTTTTLVIAPTPAIAAQTAGS